MVNIFFDSWESMLRTFCITIFAYIFMVLLLRSSGKRTLSKMNAFDFIVTIALGSTLSAVTLNKNIPLLDGMLVFFLLIYLQYAITYLSVRSETISSFVKSTPTLLVYKGILLKSAMKKERVNKEEIYAIIRKKGMQSVEDAGAIILETDGSLTVVKNVDSLQNPVMSRINLSV
jgi:uncharacterized membrane protein YcaP (DUF421 family)